MLDFDAKHHEMDNTVIPLNNVLRNFPVREKIEDVYYKCAY